MKNSIFTLLVLALILPLGAVSEALPETPMPKLVLVVSVDQLRRDRVNASFPGGIGQMVREGRAFLDANLDHGITSTCPGHAAVLSGRAPGPAGIPNNTYIDHTTMQATYCVEDTDAAYSVLGGQGIRSPRALQASTLGDWMKAANPSVRVFAVGGKDRAVITMAGHRADGVFWYDKQQGRFTTSGYYAATLPDYIQAFNGRDALKDGFLQDLAETWTHDAGHYRQDDYVGESEQFGRSSGHPLGMGDAASIFTQVFKSPVVDTKSVALAKLIAEAENLGGGHQTDLLILALSATDTVGHLYGPRSAEAEDTLKNVDRELGALIAYLEKKLGKENLLLVLTADHGVAELPEFMAEKTSLACPQPYRLTYKSFAKSIAWRVYWRYTRPFDKPTELIKFDASGIVLNRQYLKDKGLDFHTVLAELDDVITAFDRVEAVWRPDEIKHGTSETARLLRNSFTEGKSADLLIQFQRDCILMASKSGTTHGSVYDYDRNIPVIFYGWGVQAGQIKGEAHSVDIAPTLAQHLNIKMPAELDGKPLPLGN